MPHEPKHKDKEVVNNWALVLFTGCTTFCATKETIMCQLLQLKLLKDVLEPFRPDPHLLPHLFTIPVRMVGLALRGAGKFDCYWYMAL